MDKKLGTTTDKNNNQISSIPKQEYYIDRELSWLDFNKRVLECAQATKFPLLERLKYLAIFSSNLDEFFMVRVSGLKRRYQSGIEFSSKLETISTRKKYELVLQKAKELALAEDYTFLHTLLPELNKKNIKIYKWKNVPEKNQKQLTEKFKNEIFPILTPLAVDLAHPFPYISGLSINLGVSLENNRGDKLFSRIKVPNNVPRFIELTYTEEYGFLPLEELISAHLELLFPGMQVLECKSFRITRNADLFVSEDKDENLLKALERELARRKFGAPVRLEVEADISEYMLHILVTELDINENEVIKIPGILDLSSMFQVYDEVDEPSLKFTPFIPTTLPAFLEVEEGKSVFNVLKQSDILVQHPYQSFSTSVQTFIEQAAEDPNVLAIKQTLYRTSGDSPIVNALIKAAEAGKQVVALVEIKARFDEENNITWARKLERAGAHVVYGIVGLKTHCKTCLVVRREANEIKRYCHIGTGNYNPKTARSYEDLGLLTSSPEIGADLTELFNALTGYSTAKNYKNLLVAPNTVRSGIRKRIEQEIEAHKAGKEAGIRIKINSIVDEKIINSLYKASQAGVKVEMLVRSICSLRAGIPNLSENITVRSVLGRFLEHSRIFNFKSSNEYWIGSSDLMHRNLDRRVEVLVQVLNPRLSSRIGDILDLAFNPNTVCWTLKPDNSWEKINSSNPKGISYQTELAKKYNKSVKKTKIDHAK